MTLHPLVGSGTYLAKCGHALRAMADSGRLEVLVDSGDVCTLPGRVPRPLWASFDVLDTTNVGDYTSPLAMLTALGPLVKPGR